MPPTRLLVKDFITSLVTSEVSEKKSISTTKSHIRHELETMVISDDENDKDETNILRRRAIQQQQDNMQAEIVKKKEAFRSVEKKMRNMKLDVVDEFEI